MFMHVRMVVCVDMHNSMFNFPLVDSSLCQGIYINTHIQMLTQLDENVKTQGLVEFKVHVFLVPISCIFD